MVDRVVGQRSRRRGAQAGAPDRAERPGREAGRRTARGDSVREAFVRTTAELLQRQGYAASGLNEIVARSGAPRGSLYFHFPGGKEELAVAAIDSAGAQLGAA